MSDPYQFWRDRLAGKDVVAHPDTPMAGFYKAKQGRGKDATYLPVAVFESGGELIGVIGHGPLARILRGDALAGQFNFFNKNVISEEVYRHAESHGNWPNSDPTVTAAKAAKVDPPAIQVEGQPDAETVGKIEEGITGAAVYAKIEDDTTSAKAQELRSHLTTLAGKLDKDREALVRPHLDAQRDINSAFNPHIKSAKEAADAIKRAQSAWETDKRTAQRLAAEAAAKAAAEAEAAGKPAPVEQPKTNAPPPSEQIRGATGRAASVKEKEVVVDVDVLAVLTQFAERPTVVAFAREIAQKAIDAGIKVPGAKTEMQAVVR